MRRSVVIAFVASVLVGCGAGAANERSGASPRAGASGDEREIPAVQEGDATFYSDSLAGSHTASGVPYDPSALTAAHRTLPLGTRVRVTRTDTARSVEVEINDRGPFGSSRRIIDLSRAAAERLQMLRAGVVPVTVEVLVLGHGRHRRHARR